MTNNHTGLDLATIWRALVRSKVLILGLPCVAGLIAAAYSYAAPEWYRAEVTLAPASSSAPNGLGAQLSGLAALAGVSIRSTTTAEPLAVLRSRELSREFIAQRNLTSILSSPDSRLLGRWREAETEANVVQVGAYFDDVVKRVNEDPRTGLVTLTIDWVDANLAAEWANAYVSAANEKMRQRALDEAQSNIRYLKSEFGTSDVIEMQRTIGRVLESEMQRYLLAQGNGEFAFRVIDAAVPPTEPSRPKRLLIVTVTVVLSGLIAATLLVMREALNVSR